MRYAVEVKLVERPDEWKRMRHTFDDAEAAERIRRAARAASDVIQARVVTIGSTTPDIGEQK